MPDCSVEPRRTKRAATPEHVQSFENGGLTGAIGAGDQRGTGVELELRVLNATELLDLGGEQRHATRPYSRIGMTTYLVPVEPGARIRALLLASVRPNSISELSTAVK